MKRFKKILVGVDLSWGDHFVSEELTPSNAEAVRQALWLAKLNSASIDFLFSLDISAKAEELIAEGADDEPNVVSVAKAHMLALVEEAREAGLVADSHVAVGKSWLQLIRMVLREQHDLVLVGTRHRGVVKETFLGSTGVKLLRKCPCALWVTQPPQCREINSILIAHDMRPVGDLAMELGCAMAELQDAQLHVLHADEYPELDSMLPAGVSAECKQAYHNEAVRHIESRVAKANLPKPAEVHFVCERPDKAILRCIEQHEVDLLVMGTVGSTGIAGLIMGDTAERLLPRIPCSLLAVKPPGFVSPVTATP